MEQNGTNKSNVRQFWVGNKQNPIRWYTEAGNYPGNDRDGMITEQSFYMREDGVAGRKKKEGIVGRGSVESQAEYDRRGGTPSSSGSYY